MKTLRETPLLGQRKFGPFQLPDQWTQEKGLLGVKIYLYVGLKSQGVPSIPLLRSLGFWRLDRE
jgi:hypothetical protein